MNPPIIIGITGYKRSGKDEVYNALRRAFYDVRRIAFADPLKQELAKACEVTPEFIEQHKENFRLGMQWWGTEFRRELFGHDYWIRRSAEQLDKILATDSPDVVVFTDCRFPNEADFVKSRGGVVWRVLRDVKISDDHHASERAMDDYSADQTFFNDSTLDAFYKKIVQAVESEFYERLVGKEDECAS